MMILLDFGVWNFYRLSNKCKLNPKNAKDTFKELSCAQYI